MIFLDIPCFVRRFQLQHAPIVESINTYIYIAPNYIIFSRVFICLAFFAISSNELYIQHKNLCHDRCDPTTVRHSQAGLKTDNNLEIVESGVLIFKIKQDAWKQIVTYCTIIVSLVRSNVCFRFLPLCTNVFWHLA